MKSISFGRYDSAGVDPITAATTAQATATALTGAVNDVTTAVGQTGVILPAGQALGSPILVVVNSATAALLFPPVGGKINNGSVNASFSVAQNKPALCFQHSNGLDYHVVLSA